MRLASLMALAALLVPAEAAAHVEPKPPFVTAGSDDTVSLDTPNERTTAAMTELVVEAPPDVTIVEVAAPVGWEAESTREIATFTGGSLDPGATLQFVATLRAARAGTSTLRAVQRFDDGRQVDWDVDVSVLPAAGAAAPDQHLGRALVAASIGVIAVALSLLVVHRLRRGSLQEK